MIVITRPPRAGARGSVFTTAIRIPAPTNRDEDKNFLSNLPSLIGNYPWNNILLGRLVRNILLLIRGYLWKKKGTKYLKYIYYNMQGINVEARSDYLIKINLYLFPLSMMLFRVSLTRHWMDDADPNCLGSDVQTHCCRAQSRRPLSFVPCGTSLRPRPSPAASSTCARI